MKKKRVFLIIYIVLALFFLVTSTRAVSRTSTQASTVLTPEEMTLSQAKDVTLSEDGAYLVFTPTSGSASVLLTLPELKWESGWVSKCNTLRITLADEVTAGNIHAAGVPGCIVENASCLIHFDGGIKENAVISSDVPIRIEQIEIADVLYSYDIAPNPISMIALAVWALLGIFLALKTSFFEDVRVFFVKERDFCKQLFTSKRLFVLHVASLIGIAIYALALLYALLCSTFMSNKPLYVMGAALVFLLFAADALLVRKNAHPARLMLAALLLIGTAIAVVLPAATVVSWDDEYHFAHAAYPSALLAFKELSAADFMLQFQQLTWSDYAQYTPTNMAARLLYDSTLSWRSVTSFLPADLLSSFHPLMLLALPFAAVYYAFIYAVYAPTVLAFFLSRLVGADVIFMFTLGRLANLALYAFVLYFGIKRLSRGGTLFALVALIPTAVFLSVSYTADAYVTAFILSGLAVFIAAFQKKKPLSRGEMAAMIALIAIGCGPKAIYFIMLFPLLFLPKECFRDAKSQKRFRLAVCIVAFLVLVSFLLPFLIDMGSKTDLRGGSDVSASEQIKFILKEPLRYTQILLGFLADYVSFPNTLTHLSFLAYLGNVGNLLPSVYLALMLYAAFTDRGVCDLGKGAVRVRLASLFTAFAALCLVATSLYVGYTPVGHPTVLGCQYRYIFPILPLLLYAVPAPASRRSALRGTVLVSSAAVLSAICFLEIYF